MRTYQLTYQRIGSTEYATPGFTRYIKAVNIKEVLNFHPHIESIDFSGHKVAYELTGVKLDD